MNQKHWLRILQHTDEKYIEEADPAKGRQKRKWPGVLAACLCCVIAAGSAFLFWPYPDQLPETSQFQKSEYYDLIQVLNKLTYRAPEYGNRYEMLLGNVTSAVDDMLAVPEADMMMEGIMEEPAADVPEETTAAVYQEITDNQVSGVTEADRIKRTDKHIFYLDGDVLRVYDIAGEATEMISHYSFSDTVKTGGLADQWEFYLSADGTRVNVIAPCLDENNRRQLQVICLDVSDPANISQVNRFGVSGQNLSSRVTGDSLLLMTRYRPTGQTDFTDETTFVPQIQCNGETKSIPGDKIVIPENPTEQSYVLVMKLDMTTLELYDCMALLSFTDKLYVSPERIYAVSEYVAEPSENCTCTMSQLVWFDYTADSFGTAQTVGRNTVQVEGTVKDQYSLDEHEGILRVVTTTQKGKEGQYYLEGVTEEVFVSYTNETSANLYCIDLESGQIAGKAEQFAPLGEQVRSVRFDGTAAYVCTAVELTDPVFFFDLSDVNNITYKDTGNIEGFSSSLVNFGNGYLLGIGRGSDWNTLKIEVYAETVDAVESVCSFELEQVYWSEIYKSYYIDRQNQLLGMGYVDEQGSSRYMVLLFDGYELNGLLDTAIAGEPDAMRGVLIDDWFYLFGREEFKTEKIF